jgi:uncharacterized repeat protein (TIGR03803 family)
VGTNSLFFGTTGPNSTPGAIIRYDMDAKVWTNLFSFSTNAENALAYGTRPGYSAFVEWLGELYFLTRNGGSSNYGIVAKYNIASNTVVKLADLEGQGGLALGRATGIFDNTGLIVEEFDRFYIYYTVTSGGENNRGTILRVALPAPPIIASLATDETNALRLTWTGGYPPFTVQSCSRLPDGEWMNEAEGLTLRSMAISASESARYFRIVGSP